MLFLELQLWKSSTDVSTWQYRIYGGLTQWASTGPVDALLLSSYFDYHFANTQNESSRDSR
jgi:hypothetical protein